MCRAHVRGVRQEAALQSNVPHTVSKPARVQGGRKRGRAFCSPGELGPESGKESQQQGPKAGAEVQK